MYKPKIGDSGIYILKEPFHKLMTPQVIYTCRSIRTISDVMSSGVSVFDKYYQPLAVSQELYLQDVLNNTCIIGLQAGTGEWVYVPESFILSPPKTDGVKYSSIVLGVGMGAIPDELNLDALIAQLKDVVMDYIGVDPKIKAVLVSQPAFIDHDKHERLELARKAKITATETTYAKAQRLEKENNTLQLKVTELEAYIKRII